MYTQVILLNALFKMRSLMCFLKKSVCRRRWSGQIFSKHRLKFYIDIVSIPLYKRGKGKGKVLPRTGHEGPEGEQMYSSNLLLTSALDGGWMVSTTPLPLYPRERPGTHCTGGWVGPRASLDRCGKSRPHRDSIPVASRYTDWAIPSHLYNRRSDLNWQQSGPD